MTDTRKAEITLIDLFQETVKKYPNNPAIIDKETIITYEEMNGMANQMANYLKQQGIQKGDKVAVLGYRNNTAIIGIMGILKLGAVFVPLDPGVPEQRTKYIRENSEWKYLLDTKKENEWKNFSNEYEMISIDSNSLAYIIYTSGSTGQPKGVMISNAAAVNTILDINKKFNITSNDKNSRKFLRYVLIFLSMIFLEHLQPVQA